MIDLTRKQQTILKHLNGQSNRQIARDLHIHKDTVGKYVTEYEEQKAALLKGNPSADPEELISSIIARPTYDTSNRLPRKVTPDMLAAIKQCLRDNEMKRLRGMSKQQMKKKDIHEYLLREGFNISYSTVKRVINDLEQQHKEAYIRQEYDYGMACEFDWGEVKLNIGGAGYHRYQLAVFAPAKSDYRYGRLYMAQDNAAFQESHAEFFETCSGVFHTMVYDNMKVAVKRFVGITEKEPTDGLLELSTYYGFNFRFCNIHAGNEKGHVERNVEYIRRKAFSGPGEDCFHSLEEANAHLAAVCFALNSNSISDGTIPNETFALEQANMLPLPPKFQGCIKTRGKVDKYSTIVFKGNHYSVPDTLVGENLDIRVYTNRLVAYYRNQVVATHVRNYEKKTWTIDIYHYLRTMKRKPGALAASVALSQTSEEIKAIYETHYTSAPKDFLDILQLMSKHGEPSVIQAVKRLAVLSPLDMNPDKVEELLTGKIPRAPIVQFNAENKIEERSKESLPMYDALRGIQSRVSETGVAL